MLANALVVLGLGQYLVVAAVGEHEHRALDAAEELLDDNAGRRHAEHPAEHLAKLALGLFERGEYQHALAGAKAVGLEHVGSLEALKEGQPFVERGAVERAVAGCRYVVPLHESLGEIL